MHPTTSLPNIVMLFVLASVVSATPAAAQLHDHLKCYKIKDTASFTASVNLRPADDVSFPADAGCTVKVRSRQLCFPVDEIGVTSDADLFDVSGQELSNAFLCYALKCPAAEIPESLQMRDRFGTRTLTGLRTSTICMPALVGPPPTTTTLPHGPARLCENATPPNCDGTCNNNNLSCMEDAGACICVSVDVFGPCPMLGHGVPECYGSCEGTQTCIEESGACKCGYAFE